MTTEVILFIIAIFEFTVLVLLNRLRSEFIVGSILVNLILIATFGAQLVSVFGFVTNIGNIFYVSISLAIYLLIEKGGCQNAQRSIFVAFTLMILFLTLSQLSINIPSIHETKFFAKALHEVFGISPRIALGSLLAFLLSQHVNLYFYEWLRMLTKGRMLWLRSNASNIVTQVIDSAIFFLVAFAVSVPLSEMLGIMIVGFVVKVAGGLIATPFLYISYFSERSASPK